jgi:hypothetical protein
MTFSRNWSRGRPDLPHVTNGLNHLAAIEDYDAAGGAPSWPPSERRLMSDSTHKPKASPVRTSPGLGAPPLSNDTVPDLDVAARHGLNDTMPEPQGVYVPPRKLASPADHRTIEIHPVRLAQEIDPRRALTELRLTAPLPERRPRYWLAIGAVLVLAAVTFAVFQTLSREEPPAASAPEPVAPRIVTQPTPTVRPVTTASQPVATARRAKPVETKSEELVPVTPAELDRPRPATVVSKPSGRPQESGKKKVREPWLE